MARIICSSFSPCGENKWCRPEDLNPQPTDYKSVALPVELGRHKWWRMQDLNLRPPACKAGALPAELILHIYARRRPTLAGEKPQLPSALESLTSVFGMGTGVTSLPSSPDKYDFERHVPSKLDKKQYIIK